MAQIRMWCVALLLAVLMVGCSGSENRFGNTQSQTRTLESITVTPASQTLNSLGEPAQFVASGNFSVAPATQDMTSQVQWISGDVHVATISSTGLATAVALGVTTITANFGRMVGTATLTVTATSNRGLTSITVIPVSQTVQVLGETAQYIAIGNFATSPTTQDLTNQVTWVSSDVRVATITSSGLATAIGSVDGGQTTITAIAPPSSGSEATGTATMTVSSNGTNELPPLPSANSAKARGVSRVRLSGSRAPRGRGRLHWALCAGQRRHPHSSPGFGLCFWWMVCQLPTALRTSNRRLLYGYDGGQCHGGSDLQSGAIANNYDH